MKKSKRPRRRFTDKLYFLFTFLLIIGGFAVGAVYLGKGLIRTSEIPVVYMVHGDKDVCTKATDAQGKPISCTEAMKGRVYHTEWVAPKVLRTAE